MACGRRSNRQRGFTLVEAAVAVAIMGVSAVVIWQYVGRSIQRTAEVGSQELLARAQKTLVNYALLNGRLPCPAQDNLGRESCDGAVAGAFPYVTAGLPEASAGRIRYRLGDPTLLTSPAPLTVLVPQTPPGQVAAVRVASPATAGRRLDLCQALSGSANANEVAYQLLPDTNVPFAHMLIGQTQTVSSGQLLDRIYCQAHFSAAARAHQNVHVASAVLRQALTDFREQKGFSEILLSADVIGLTWSVINATWTLSRSVPKYLKKQSDFHKSVGTDAPSLAIHHQLLAAVAVVDAVNLARQIANQSRMISLLTINTKLLSDTAEISGRVDKLMNEIGTRAANSAQTDFLFTSVQRAQP